jgi:enamine deaminase RidA (YjgF/YER057c/UK114 family)
MVAGTTAGRDGKGKVVGGDDLYLQSVAALKKIEQALAAAGASLKDVVRTRTFVKDISQFEAVAKAHREFFGDVRPAATLVEVGRLVEPELLVEIEVDAVLDVPDTEL